MPTPYELTKRLDELLHEILIIAAPRDQQIHRLATDAHGIAHDLAAALSPDPAIQASIKGMPYANN